MAVRRREREPDGDSPPERLRRFVPSEWPGTLWEASDAWHEARREWSAAHGWPGGSVAEFNEALAVIQSMPDQPFDPDGW